jgi:hypothetical protein
MKNAMTAIARVHISSRATVPSFDLPTVGKSPSALQVFQLRAWARAYLAYACVLTLPDAVDVLQESAVASGLVDELGQDAVQATLADAFADKGDNITFMQVRT